MNTVKHWIFLAAAPLLVASVTQAAHADQGSAPTYAPPAADRGTGVGGGGGDDARSQYLKHLAATMGPRLSLHGGGAELGRSVSEWCSRIAAVLRRERMRALNEYAKNHKTQAKQILVDAMLTAAESIEDGTQQTSPVTKLLLDRGLLISQALDDSLPECADDVLTSEVNFLDKYVNFVIQVQAELDVPYYVPYVYSYGRCGENCPGGFSIADFEREYLKYAREQLEFVYQTLTEVAPDEHGIGRAFPIGDGRVFLKATELVAGGVAQDLAVSLFAAREACVAQDLNELSSDLNAFNDYGDRTVFVDMPHAVRETRGALENFASRIPLYQCSAYDWSNEPTYGDSGQGAVK